MFEESEAFHERYQALFDRLVRITFRDGTVCTGLFNDEFYEDGSILVNCEVIKIADIERMELMKE